MQSIELFSGAGGLALGLHRAGFEPCALIERDRNCCKTMKENISRGFGGIAGWNVLNTDVRLVDYAGLGPEVQFITGGPPCQPFSLGGRHKAHSDNRDLFPEAIRAVREVRPLGFVFENVKGLLRQSFSMYFSYILLQLSYPEVTAKDGMDWTGHFHMLEEYHASSSSLLRSGLEYNVGFKLINAADYGVPQQRLRVVIVGFRSDMNAHWSFPEPTHTKEALIAAKADGSYWEEHRVAKSMRPHVQQARIDRRQKVSGERWRTVRDALSGLPDPHDENSVPNHEFHNGARPYAGHSGSVLDEPSKAIKAGAHGVPGGENMLVEDNGSTRYFTVRESARIQTFPDDYVFCGAWGECMRQLGNAVPVKLAELIGESVMKSMERAYDYAP